MKRDIKFKTKDGSIAFLEVEITDRNNYLELSICGEHNGGHGQCYDSIKPKTKLQKELLNIWNTKHLKKVTEIEILEIAELLEAIEQEQNKLYTPANLVSEQDEEEMLEKICEINHLDNNSEDAEKILALAIQEEITVGELDNITGNGTSFSFGGREWIVATDAEADQLQDEDFDNYIEDCVLPELQGNLKNYFDEEAWKRDARIYGRGNSLSHYDGHEQEKTVNNTTYYLYRN